MGVLFKNDLGALKKDPLLIVTLCMPIILWGVYWLLQKGIAGLLYDLSVYEASLQYVMLAMGSSMAGVVVALRLLE